MPWSWFWRACVLNFSRHIFHILTFHVFVYLRTHQSIDTKWNTFKSVNKILAAHAEANRECDNPSILKLSADENLLHPLFRRIFCMPAISPSVERIFSHSGIIMRPRRTTMSNELQETLTFLKFNQKQS